MGTNSDGFDAHLNDWVVIAARLGHIAKIKNFWLFDFEFFHEVGHAENLVHARSDSVNGSGAADFVFEFWRKFFTALNDGFAFFTIWIPGIFSFGAGFLAEGREGNLAEAVFDNLVAIGEFIFFPVAKFFSGFFDGFGDFGNLFVSEWIILNLIPIFLIEIVAVILSALGNKEVKMAELFWGSASFD